MGRRVSCLVVVAAVQAQLPVLEQATLEVVVRTRVDACAAAGPDALHDDAEPTASAPGR